MKILMLKTTKGSTNGIVVQEYVKGETYDITSESLVKVFISNGFAKVCPEVFEELKSEPLTYDKKVMPNPENKKAKVKEDDK